LVRGGGGVIGLGGAPAGSLPHLCDGRVDVAQVQPVVEQHQGVCQCACIQRGDGRGWARERRGREEGVRLGRDTRGAWAHMNWLGVEKAGRHVGLNRAPTKRQRSAAKGVVGVLGRGAAARGTHSYLGCRQGRWRGHRSSTKTAPPIPAPSPARRASCRVLRPGRCPRRPPTGRRGRARTPGDGRRPALLAASTRLPPRPPQQRQGRGRGRGRGLGWPTMPAGGSSGARSWHRRPPTAPEPDNE